jgi:hypothetical protein
VSPKSPDPVHSACGEINFTASSSASAETFSIGLGGHELQKKDDSEDFLAGLLTFCAENRLYYRHIANELSPGFL